MLLAACTAKAPEPAPAPQPEARPVAAAGDRAYELTASELLIYVYRDGPLKRLGHNHVVASRELTGSIDETGGEVLVQLDRLTVDDAALRAEAGEGFESTPSESDIEGTRRNMLSPKLLNAALHPTLEVQVAVAEGVASDSAELVVHLAGERAMMTVPIVVVREDDDRLSITSEFPLTHEQLGLSPYSALGGALRVADELLVRVSITAAKRS